MYRILHEADLIGERRRGHRRTSSGKRAVPRVHATGPNQVWSFDISRLAGPVARSWFYLYGACQMLCVGAAVSFTEAHRLGEEHQHDHEPHHQHVGTGQR
jgi:putative transposase